MVSLAEGKQVLNETRLRRIFSAWRRVGLAKATFLVFLAAAARARVVSSRLFHLVPSPKAQSEQLGLFMKKAICLSHAPLTYSIYEIHFPLPKFLAVNLQLDGESSGRYNVVKKSGLHSVI
jgi:hypothetical protein